MTNARACAIGLLFLLCAVALAVTLRISAPSDLYDNDQPKTVAYTADIASHGRWALPVDMLGRPATKPPLYNWVGVLCAWTAGRWSEFVLKLPSLLAMAVTLGVVLAVGWRWASGELRPPTDPNRDTCGTSPGWMQRHPGALAIVAGLAWLANYSTFKLMYTARPDMLLVAFMTVGWAAATVLMRQYRHTTDNQSGDNTRPPRGHLLPWQLLFWLALAGAALAKGPQAILLVIYLLIGAKLVGGRWAALRTTGWWWGLVLSGGLIGAWLFAVTRADAAHLTDQLLRQQILDRAIELDIKQLLLGPVKPPLYLLVFFAPGSIFTLLALADLLRRPRCWTDHPVGPALLWVVVVVGFSMIIAGALGRDRADYLAPAYPAAALAGAWWIVAIGRRYRLQPAGVLAVGLVMLIGLGVHAHRFSPAARTRYGEHLKRFARQVHLLVGSEALALDGLGYVPLGALIGRNVIHRPLENPAAYRWVVRPMDQPGPGRLIASSLPIAFASPGRPAGRLGLYQLGP
jgi:4-amino-4-deoxy-L-arabinose transferase-like glycosyltransferase